MREAIILAGGRGDRLRQILPDRPKPMANVAGIPFLEILLRDLNAQGFSHVILSVGYLREQITNYFGENFRDIKLSYSEEDEPLGTGGAIKKALKGCRSDHVFVFNGDTFVELNFDYVEARYREIGSTIIVAVHVDDTSRFGRLVAKNNRVSSWTEKGISGPGLINSGCYFMAQSEYLRMPKEEVFSFESYLARRILEEEMGLFVADGVFIDIGIPESYSSAQTLMRPFLK